MLLVRRTLGKFSTQPLSRRLSSRASAVLSALDIPTTPTELPGVYDGEWKGSGEIFQSVCPATGEVLAHVKSVSYNIYLPSKFYYKLNDACWWPGRACLLLLRNPYQLPRDHPHRHHQRSSMAHWRGREKHTFISEVYPRQREAR